MKTIISLLVIVFANAVNNGIHAQMDIDLGIKGGISIPNLTSGKEDNPINTGYKSRTGPAFAIYAEFHLTKKFSIQPELQYCAEGGKKNGNQAFALPAEISPMFPPGQAPRYLFADYRSTAKFNYLLLPILAKYHLPFNESWDFYVGVGPFASVLLNAKNITRGTSTIFLDPAHTQPLIPNQSFDRKENIKDELHKFNAGVAGHLGIAYHLGGGSIFLEGGGNFGFINIQKGEENGKNKTGAGVIMIGYAIKLY
ncbi:MAG: porin family protein [Chitinophagaceae bacterium]